MLNNPQEIEAFKDYQAAGGLQKPASYHMAIAIVPLAEQAKNQLSGAVNSELNYNADGISELPEALLTLSGEADEALSSANAMITYLGLAANPTDIEQVAIGVGIIRKLAGTDNDDPAPSILPVTNADDITALKANLVTLHSSAADAITLMGKINTAITPTPAIPPAPTLPTPPLPNDLKQQALAMITTIKPLLGTVSAKALAVSKLVSLATIERQAAIVAFNDCIAFTMLNGQKTKPSVSDAANAIYPKVIFKNARQNRE